MALWQVFSKCSFWRHSAYFHSALYPSFRRKNPHRIFRKLPLDNFPHSAIRILQNTPSHCPGSIALCTRGSLHKSVKGCLPQIKSCSNSQNKIRNIIENNTDLEKSNLGCSNIRCRKPTSIHSMLCR